MWVYILLGILVLLGTAIQGTIGFGLGTLATPIIALVKPELVPTVILFLAFFISSYMLYTNLRDKGGIDTQVIAISSACRIPGSLLAAWVLTRIDESGLQVFIAVAVILAMTLSSLGWSPGHSPTNTALAGVTSGFFGTITSIGGPPMALILKDFDPEKVRSTLAGTFVIGSAISMATLALTGAATAHQFLVAVAYLPLAAAGLAIARVWKRRVDTVALNRLVVAVSLAAAGMLLAVSVF
ncbi:permease [Corynebacterium phocae]|uniref:Probable membrane transporter protein n=1 Tax=Corynebacterium phocae TaxID=161895 RepID=A0A1L7D4X0_9CORY|nr:sulfite exporter TauE/SafE family protein [Corynebacterium phocae]APT93107.1 permease [Corynebacterium phocae]KAA8722411.1 sulfite exporter TauE/SafE family protein [Corynebacterium phocae]